MDYVFEVYDSESQSTTEINYYDILYCNIEKIIDEIESDGWVVVSYKQVEEQT